MKERVLFVDDEPNILNGLRRMLRSKRTNWELHFANSGPEALDLMQTHEIDIIVSDMKMPGMDGAELLTETCKRHPNTIRIILSGYADQEAVLRTIGPAHQYLAKPCDRDVLLETVSRSLDLRNILGSETLRTIANGLETLPTPSDVFNQLIRELAQKSASTAKIAAIIETDVSLAANFLKLTNSAYFGFSNNRLNLTEAVQRLGADTIKAIIMVAGTFRPYEGTPEELEQIKELGQRSITTGRLARSIAKALQQEHRTVDQSYIAGTLSHVGTHLLITEHSNTHAEICQMANEHGRDRSRISRELLGASVSEIGGYLLGIWGFTDPIIEAVVFQCEPSNCTAARLSPLTCVHIAQCLINTTETYRDLDLEYIEKLGLTDRLSEFEELHQAIVEELHSEATPHAPTL